MKLAVPAPHVRFIVGSESITPIVGGVFPPERADDLRNVMEVAARRARPSVRDEIERQHAAWIHRLIYGFPGATEPRGLLNA